MTITEAHWHWFKLFVVCKVMDQCNCSFNTAALAAHRSWIDMRNTQGKPFEHYVREIEQQT